MYPRSGFRSWGTCERTLVPVFVPGEHPNVPSFWFSFRGNIRQNHPSRSKTLDFPPPPPLFCFSGVPKRGRAKRGRSQKHANEGAKEHKREQTQVRTRAQKSAEGRWKERKSVKSKRGQREGDESCDTLRQFATFCDTLRHLATSCDTLRHFMTISVAFLTWHKTS